MLGNEELDWLEARIDVRMRNIRLRERLRRSVGRGWVPVSMGCLAAARAVWSG